MRLVNRMILSPYEKNTQAVYSGLTYSKGGKLVMKHRLII